MLPNELPKNKTYRQRAAELVAQARESFESYRGYVAKHVPSTSATFRAVMRRLEYRAKKVESEISEYEMLVRMNPQATEKTDRVFYGFLGHFMRFLPQQQLMVMHDISTTALLVKPELEESELIFDSKSRPGTVVVRESRTYMGSDLGMILKTKQTLTLSPSRTVPAGTYFFIPLHGSNTEYTQPLRYIGTYEEVKALLKRDSHRLLSAIIADNALALERMGKLNPENKGSSESCRDSL